MREVVHRVDAPRIAGAVVMGVADAVEHRVAQHDVRRGHVDLGAQHVLAVAVLAGAHVAEQRQVFRHRAVTERRGLARLGEVAARGGDLLGGLAVHIGGAALDQRFRKGVQLLEVVAGVVQVRLAARLGGVPREAEPVHGVDDRVDILGVFLDRIGVVEAQVAAAGVVARQAEVHADALGVANVQVAVRLRREARDDRRQRGALAVRAAGVGACGQVLVDDAAQEVRGGRVVGGLVGRLVVLAHGGAASYAAVWLGVGHRDAPRFPMFDGMAGFYRACGATRRCGAIFRIGSQRGGRKWCRIHGRSSHAAIVA
ncbi:hypothetical protein D3C86_1121350 [compost metagenome]